MDICKYVYLQIPFGSPFKSFFAWILASLFGLKRQINFFVLSLLQVLFSIFLKNNTFNRKKKSVKGQMYGTLNRVYRVSAFRKDFFSHFLMKYLFFYSELTTCFHQNLQRIFLSFEKWSQKTFFLHSQVLVQYGLFSRSGENMMSRYQKLLQPRQLWQTTLNFSVALELKILEIKYSKCCLSKCIHIAKCSERGIIC